MALVLFLILRELYRVLPTKSLYCQRYHRTQEVCAQEVITVSTFHHIIESGNHHRKRWGGGQEQPVPRL